MTASGHVHTNSYLETNREARSTSITTKPKPARTPGDVHDKGLPSLVAVRPKAPVYCREVYFLLTPLWIDDTDN